MFTPNDANCNDGVSCTDDMCDATLDCQFMPNDANCNDGVSCTDDTCDATLDCQFTPNDANCNDGVSCTDDACDATLDCQFTPNDANCNDGVACTDDTCDATLDCQFTPNDANCNDGVSCTDDVCDATLDCKFTPNDANCDDGVACTDDVCDATLDCQFTPNDANCDDGVACTDDVCDATLDCQFTPNDANCDDGVACTDDTCDLVNDCQFTPNDSNCDDGEPCTLNMCDPQSPTADANGCDFPPDPAHTPCDVFCALSGSAGSVVDCWVNVAKRSGQPASGAQFFIVYDSSLLAFQKLADELCIPGFGCMEIDLSTAGALTSGHSVSYNPPAFADWDTNIVDPANGLAGGEVLIAHLQAPATPLTNATEAPDGSIAGDPKVLKATFLLNVDIPASNPVFVTTFVGASPDAAIFSVPGPGGTVNTLNYDILSGVVRTY